MIILSYQPSSFREFKKVVDFAHKNGAGIIEIRGEKISEKELKKTFQLNSLPLLFTYRITHFSYSKIRDAIKKYNLALEYNVSYIDIDLNLGKSVINKIKRQNKSSKVILSYHNYEKTPKLQYLIKILEYARKISADYYKIVTYANTFEDNYYILKLLEYANRKRIPLIAHCLGELGKSGRFLTYKYGSKFFYSSLDNSSQTASGQIAIKILNEIFRINKLKLSTKIFGVVGTPLKQSRGWLFHNYAFTKTKSNAVYLNFLTSDIEEFIYLFKNYIDGISITIPFKEDILKIPNISSTRIKSIGSANTAIFKDSKPVLFNTDYLAINELVKKYKHFSNSRILVLGAGGTARTIVWTLKKYNNEIFIVNRTIEKAKLLSEEMNVNFVSPNKKSIPKFDVVINTTPNNNSFLLNTVKRVFRKSKPKLVLDLELNFPQSQLRKMCKSRKIKYIDGFEFFVIQASHQFKIFTGKSINSNTIKKFVIQNYNMTF